MKYYGKAEGVATKILEAFQHGRVPEALAAVFVDWKDENKPCRKWSWTNRFLAALFGQGDARGFRQWEAAGRKVRKGEKAFYILVPLVKQVKEQDPATGQERERAIVFGFKAAPVFGVQQTEGKPLPGEAETRRFIEALPLVEVARAWGLKVDCFNGEQGQALGFFTPGGKIGLGVTNLATWAHELVHAADHRNTPGGLKPGQRLDQEVVAELGGLVLLECLGHEVEADRGGAWRYIEGYCRTEGKEPVAVCMSLLKRTCEALDLIFNTAEQVKGSAIIGRQEAA